MLELLKKVRLFSGLDETALSALQDALQPLTLAAGEDLCCEGESGDRMFVIESGEVAVLKAVEGEEPIEVTVLKSGDVAGEMGLFDQETRSRAMGVSPRASSPTCQGIRPARRRRSRGFWQRTLSAGSASPSTAPVRTETSCTGRRIDTATRCTSSPLVWSWTPSPWRPTSPIVVFSAKTTIGNIHEYELGKRGSELTNAVVFRGS